ncbi:hypothetical protein CKM354_000459900 [Cercospora kikuchii]|uniref:Uncharacterized protein n=1 Tax=Cercospora kikuchii TaxID=84275 RepID=A0A9P3CEG7_9PEZI|nr:uncharacterized protein CKM354_000459900 [Cercospora kikuchii]GIZ41288.1 hypothetical protein CKM354_000459900 [Cercospora kikuchii]
MERDLRGYVETNPTWNVDLPRRTKAVNSRYIAHLGHSPAEIAFGCRPSDMAPTEWALPTPSKQDLVEWMTAPDFDLPRVTEMGLLVYKFMAARQAIHASVTQLRKIRLRLASSASTTILARLICCPS